MNGTFYRFSFNINYERLHTKIKKHELHKYLLLITPDIILYNFYRFPTNLSSQILQLLPKYTQVTNKPPYSFIDKLL